MISQKYFTAITRYATRTHNHHHQRLIAQHYRQQQNLSTNTKQKPVVSRAPNSTNTSTTTSPSTTPTKTLWKQLKAPVLFGVGLYLGFMVFGEHQETKQGSAYLEGLRAKFWSGVDYSDDSGNADGKQG